MKKTAFGSAVVIVMLFAGFVFVRSMEANRQLRESRAQLGVLEKTFDDYERHIVEGDIVRAYQVTSERFRSETDSESFALLFRDIEKKYGAIRRIERNKVRAQSGSAYVGEATVSAEFYYQNGKITIIHQFHQDGRKWLLDSFMIRE